MLNEILHYKRLWAVVEQTGRTGQTRNFHRKQVVHSHEVHQSVQLIYHGSNYSVYHYKQY